MCGYFEIGIYNGKTSSNLGTLWRTAYQMGAAGIFTIAHRYHMQSSDTTKTPRHIPLRQYKTFTEFLANRPYAAWLVGVEIGGRSLEGYGHPQQAIYLLGAEDHGLPKEILAACNSVISIDSVRTASFNVAVAGAIIMFHRNLRKR